MQNRPQHTSLRYPSICPIKGSMITPYFIFFLLITTMSLTAQDTSSDSAWMNFDSYWNYSQPAETAEKFRELLDQVPTKSSYHIELLTQLARTQGLQRKFDEAHAILDEAETLLEENDMERPRVRYLLERGRAF